MIRGSDTFRGAASYPSKDIADVWVVKKWCNTITDNQTDVSNAIKHQTLRCITMTTADIIFLVRFCSYYCKYTIKMSLEDLLTQVS